MHDGRDVHVRMVCCKGIFEYIPSALREMVEPDVTSMTVVPLKNVVRPYGERVELIIDRVVQVEERKAVLASGQVLEFDFCIIATGVAYSPPIHATDDPQMGGAADRSKELMSWLEELQKARSVLVVGGGITGVELVTEIADKFPNKQLVLVSSSPEPLPELPPRARRATRRHLERKKIVLFTNAHAEKQDDGSYKINPKDDSREAQVLTPDMCVMCVGGKPNSDVVGEQYRDRKGKVLVEETLAVQGMNNRVFCSGDVASRVGQHAYWAEFSGFLVGKNVLLERHGRPLKRYPQDAYGVDFEPMMTAVSLGKRNGVFVIGSIATSGALVAAMKSLLRMLIMWHVEHRIGGFIYPASVKLLTWVYSLAHRVNQLLPFGRSSSAAVPAAAS